MKEPPFWLPPLLEISSYGSGTLDQLLEVFEEGFGPPTQCYFRGCPVWFDSRGGKYPEGLWHLVSRGQGVRDLDFERVRRMAWCAAIIQNSDENEVLCWHFLHDSKFVRAALWLKDWDYVVFLVRLEKPKGAVYKLVTGYCVDKEYKRRNLQKDYEKRLEEDASGHPILP